MPISDLHRRVATIVLNAAAEHGFALGGGNALLAHGIITRPTQDVDVFTNREHGVETAAGSVEAALRSAGFQAERIDKTAGLGDIFGEEMGQGMAEWAVTAASGEKMALQLAYFDRGREPVIMEIGPVLDLEDVAGGKTCALASRIEPRDYSDIAAMLDHYTPGQLITFARRLDPGLEGRDYADAGRRLDQMTNERLAASGITPEGVAAIREKFASWPRDPEQIDQQNHATAEQDRGEPEQDTAAAVPEPGTSAEANPKTAAAMRDLAGKLERGEESAQRLQDHRGAEATADRQQHEQNRAAGQQCSQDPGAGREPGGPEIEP